MPAAVPVKDLDHLLQETLGPDLKVESFTWKPLTDPGENYGSQIYSIDATVKRKHVTEVLNLVVKLPPPTPYLLNLFNSPLTFWKELVFYRKIAPKFLQLQIESCIEEKGLIELTPRYYGGRLGLKDPNTFDNQAAVVMENLVPMGFVIRDRLLGLDLEHTELVIRELAKLHAIVIGLKIRTPEFFKDTVMPALVHAANDTTREAIIGLVRQAHDIYKGLPEAKPYLDRIEKTLSYDYQVDYRNSKPAEPWGTMVHNDFWSNNVLFKYNDEQRPVSLKIVDFQLGFYSSGVMDLIFFLFTSVQAAILDDNLDYLLDHYYESFINCLTLLKVDTEQFSRKDFYKEVNKCAPLKFGQCTMMARVILAPRGVIKSLDEMNAGVSFPSVGTEERIITKLLHILKIFDERKWLAD